MRFFKDYFCDCSGVNETYACMHAKSQRVYGQNRVCGSEHIGAVTQQQVVSVPKAAYNNK